MHFFRVLFPDELNETLQPEQLTGYFPPNHILAASGLLQTIDWAFTN